MSLEPQTADQTAAYVPTVSFSPPSPEELTSRLPNLEVNEILGHGGMGVVYKGRQPFLDRQVAIKLIRPDFNNEDSQRNFLREARSLAKLTHPYIVNVFDCGRVGDLFYLVMEYVEGSNLRRLIGQKALSERDVLDFLPQIGEALQYAHECGIIHRDVKPENVLVDRRGRVRLVDFGLARWLGSSGVHEPPENVIAGTRSYMAPEQFSMPETVDHRVDIFSTGVVCYEMLTGRIPRNEFRPPSEFSSVDPRFDPIVLRALERERELRYQQMRDMNSDVISLTRTPDSTIRLTQTVAAPIEKVFNAWIQPAVMTIWYAPTDDHTTPIAEADPRVGGNYRVGMKHKDNTEPVVVSGQYCRVDGPHVLSFTWAWEGKYLNTPETQVTVEFQPNGEMTDMTLTHERFRDEEMRKQHTEGWTNCLRRLASKMGA